MTFINNKLPRWLTERVDGGYGNIWYESLFDFKPVDHFEKRGPTGGASF